MKNLIILSCCLLALGSASRMGAYNDMKKKIDKYNLFTQCFGAKNTHHYYKSINDANKFCKENENSVDSNAIDSFTADDFENMKGLLDSPAFGRFDRSKRSLALEDLKANIPEHMLEMKAVVSRLRCVLKKMHYIDEDNNIKTWEFENMKKMLAESPIGKDDEFLHKMHNMYTDCKEISQAWPQTMLDRHPLMAKYGRKKIYLECRYKGEMELCYKWQIYQGMKMEFGIDAGATELGLPGDKFEQAKMAMVMGFEHNDDVADKYISDFFWSQNRD